MAAVNKRMALDSLSKFRLEEKAIPQPPGGGVVVKISHAGICYSDVHMAHTPKFHPKFVYPRVLGHEISGHVHELSEGAKKVRPDLAVGDRVMVFPWGNCRNCNFCRGNCSFCSTMAYGAGPVNTYVYGVWRDGGYQNYVTIDVPEFLLKVPNGIAMEKAALVPCSGLTAYNAVTSLRESVERGTRVHGVAMVGLVGAGGLALWAIQIIKAMYSPGVRVVAIDVSDDKLADAKASGADIIHKWAKDGDAQSAVDTLIEASGRRFDAVIDFIGAAPVVERSFLSLNIGGTLTLVGLSGSMMPAMTLNSVLRRNVIIRGSMVGTLSQLKELAVLVNDGKVKPPPTELYKLEQVPEVMQKLQDGKQRGRAVIEM